MSACENEECTLTKKDFDAANPRWCPGCGNFSILKSLTTTFASLGKKKEDFLVVSGIGCSSRLPYYTDTYGAHTLHGRAPAFAIGAKAANPDLSVWIITGDGDALSIGTNHTIHLLRKNPDINVVLFNNSIYGLTKGQASPTSPVGLVTKSTSDGVVDAPVNALKLALGAGASFVARAIDTNGKLMQKVFTEAAAHKGTSFIEVLVNCVIFNDGVYKSFSSKDVRDKNTLVLEEGQPLVFGDNKEKGIKLNGLTPQITDANDKDVLTHSSNNPEFYASLLTNMSLPVPLGVYRKVEAPVFEDRFQSHRSSFDWKEKDLERYLFG